MHYENPEVELLKVREKPVAKYTRRGVDTV